MRPPSPSRKLLIASVGVATINYVAACVREPETSGNLVAPPPSSAGMTGNTDGSGVLVAGGSVGSGGESAIPPTSGNLVAPPPTTSPTAPTPPPPTTTPPPTPTPPPTSSTPPTSGNLMPPPKPLPTGGVKPPLKGH